MSLQVNIKSLFYKDKKALSNINFYAENGTITAVIGKNGSGKSTLISAILSILKFDGEIIADSQSLKSLLPKERAKTVSAIFQKLKSPHITVYDLVSFGRSPHIPFGAGYSERDLKAIDTAINSSELNSLKERYLDTLSGGELKRAYFGMLLAQDTQNLLLDEATAFMDRDYEKKFLQLTVDTVKQQNKCGILVMHSIENAIYYADKILLLHNGKQLFFGTPNELLETALIENTFSLTRHISENRIFFS